MLKACVSLECLSSIVSVTAQKRFELLMKIVPADNILFGSEMVGAIRSIDPETGHYFDDTKRYIEGAAWLTPEDKRKLFEDNARRVYPRIAARLNASRSDRAALPHP